MVASLVEPGSAAKNAPASSHDARCARVFLGGGSPDPPGESKVRRDGFEVGPADWMEGVE